MADNITNDTNCLDDKVISHVLTAAYSFILIGGVTGITMMSYIVFQSNTRSVTTTAVINLIVVHGIFLLTVPFRILYYIRNEWVLGDDFCKFVSAMIHVHMYLSFIFYVTTLVIRYLIFFKRKDKLEFYRKLHAVAASTTVWVLILVIIFPLFFIQYGNNGKYDSSKCFQFQGEFMKLEVKVVNYIVIGTVLAVVCAFLCMQIYIIVGIVRKLQGPGACPPRILAQMKSLFFILVMVFSFMPYHIFRIYYIQNANDCRIVEYNEICLSLTAASCFDMWSFVIQSNLFKQSACTALKNKLGCCCL
ncbi:putative G-protein coupled receptor 141 [Microcaecilia unicolor]|uniref:Probable G-protein coupled receptor 141 n=1 Tax=Microcaecilia unicolor TaxID=1415580 RepID=A0A6P7XWX9_9AMPH|nr:probable G-protein coupled receptor 141 [Microcaecilia unicolor]XP_030059918.1 probable G-protein coupled receptor 141 [Microcaecilia unicolor]XP_030059928.1 probable G-protein coupled receptor 141 [Microcaecilia unicolor]XP_030059937.1 probable G-protein coupled receptor 141 [Microcaecilia unicolor]XP_030059946.1 probable G-protein coupled receptor 141 [Microcaecilia unicolor]